MCKLYFNRAFGELQTQNHLPLVANEGQSRVLDVGTGTGLIALYCPSFATRGYLFCVCNAVWMEVFFTNFSSMLPKADKKLVSISFIQLSEIQLFLQGVSERLHLLPL